MSSYGHWDLAGGVPAFTYSADHRVHPEASWQPFMSRATRCHWVMVGNQRVQLLAANDGGLGLFEGTIAGLWLGSVVPERLFGPNSFTMRMQSGGLDLDRTVLCPEGEAPWVLIRVRLRATRPASFQHVEQWAVRPRFINLGNIPVVRSAQARRWVRFSTEGTSLGLLAQEKRPRRAGRDLQQVFGQEHPSCSSGLMANGSAPRRQGAGSRCWRSAPTSAWPRATPVSCGSGSASTTARRPGTLPRACAL